MLARLRTCVRAGALVAGVGVLVACSPTPATVVPSGATATAIAPTATAAPTPGTPTPPAPPHGPAGTPATARSATLQLPNRRETWVLTGVATAPFGIRTIGGELLAVFEHDDDAAHATLSAGGVELLDVYRADGGRTYVSDPLGGYVVAEPGDPLERPAGIFLGLPEALLTLVTPEDAPYRVVGATTVAGEAATRYTAEVPLADLGVLAPALRGQGGSATVTLALGDRGDRLLAGEMAFRTGDAGGAPVATARFTIGDIDQVAPITAPR